MYGEEIELNQTPGRLRVHPGRSGWLGAFAQLSNFNSFALDKQKAPQLMLPVKQMSGGGGKGIGLLLKHPGFSKGAAGHCRDSG